MAYIWRWHISFSWPKLSHRAPPKCKKHGKESVTLCPDPKNVEEINNNNKKKILMNNLKFQPGHPTE